MTVTHALSVTALFFGLAAASVPTTAVAQRNTTEKEFAGGPLTGAPKLDAPFSADATTTAHYIVAGSRVDRVARSRYYRDRAGRVRVEQVISQQTAAQPPGEGVRFTIDPEPGSGRVYTLDQITRTAAIGPRNIAEIAVGGGNSFAVPLGGPQFLVFSRGTRALTLARLDADAIHEEALGNQTLEGIETIGRRVTITIPADQKRNAGEVQLVDDRWESAELRLLIYSRSSDPRTGDVEYRVTNIDRTDPPADIFVIPSGYTTINSVRGPLDDPNSHWIVLKSAESPAQAKGGPDQLLFR